jgi:RNA polymerase subunit RPABC4/transcription elongation factor Spt4
MEVVMLGFVRDAFRGFFSFFLWVFLILCAIGGGIVGYGINRGGGAFLGVIIGVIVGVIIDIIGGGLVATLLNIDENLGAIRRNTAQSGSSSRVSQKTQKKCTKCQKEIDDDYSSCPHCGNTTFNVVSSPIIHGNITGVIKTEKKCAKCRKIVDDGYTKCPHCGNDTFE